MLNKLKKLTNKQAAIMLVVIGFTVYFTGLSDAFLGDDSGQIVDNPVIRSVTNIRLFFDGGTFYNGPGSKPLFGSYYRPLMTTAFSLIYSIFGLRPYYFHLIQLLLCIGSAILLYLFFKHFFSPAKSFILSIIFLIYPINSQVVYAIASMQDVLFFFFGISALWILVRFKSMKSLCFVAMCLLLSLLSKESGVVFIIMALLYLVWYEHKKRLYPFLGLILLPLSLYLILRIHAVGVNSNPLNAPIDNLSLVGRLMTIPSILLFYLSKLIFPWKLASAYYWVYSSFSIRHVLIPLISELIILISIVYVGFQLHRRKQNFRSFIFFVTWIIVGLLPNLQLIPLDMTASETWFYFSMAGSLGLLGVILTAYRIKSNWLFALSALFILFWGFHSMLRGYDWNNWYSLAYKDITVSKQDYVAQYVISYDLYTQGKYSESKMYALRSINIYPSPENYNDLGLAFSGLDDYKDAANAYRHEILFEDGEQLGYENLGSLTLVSGSLNSNKQFLLMALKVYPQDSLLWEYLAILEYKYHDDMDAKYAITKANEYGNVPRFLYNGIMYEKSLKIELTAKKVVLIL